MAFKLKNLKVKKVDFVDEGANPDAHIRLFKRKDDTKNDTAGVPATKDFGIARKFISFFSKLLDIDDSEGKITEDDLQEAAKAAMTEKEESQKSTEPEETPETGTNKSLEKGAEDMKFDKSKMTPEELEALEEFEKKYGVVKSDDDESDEATEATEDVSLEEEAKDTVVGDETADEVGEETEDVDKKNDVYKGLHPEVAAEIKELKKYKERAEEKELLEVAKKYEILGKKPEDLVAKFKTLKAAGGTAYDDMISVLDESVTFAEKSGLFSEVGKSGHGDMSGSAEATARNKAVDLMKTKKELTMAQAIDEVLTNDPELRARYEEED